MLRNAVLLGAAFLAVGGALAFGFTAACGDGGEPAETPPQATGDVRRIENSGTIELDRADVSPGEEVVITASEWNGTGPITLYLLTEEQRDAAGTLRELERVGVRLGEVTPDSAGSAVFRFRLEDTYDAPNGNTLRIEPGQKLSVMARQSTEGGAYATGVGPLTVGP